MSLDFWKASIAGQKPNLNYGEVEEGFWRSRDRQGRWRPPLAIWRDADGLWGKFGNDAEFAVDDAFFERFTWHAKHPISEEAYFAWREAGAWPDADPLPGIGHNQPDEVAQYEDLVAAAEAKVAEFAKVTAENESAAAGFRNRANEIASEITEHHKVEKAPVLAAGREIDSRWLRLRDRAKAAADATRRAIEAYENEKAAAQPGSAPARIEPTYGKRAPSVRIEHVAIIEDIGQVFEHFKGHNDVVGVLQRLAQMAVKMGVLVPGVSVTEKRKVA